MKRSSTRPAVLLLAAAMMLVAVLPAAAADAGGPFDVRFTGVIETVGAGDAPWVIAGKTIAIGATTRIVLTAGPAAPGMWADVQAVKQADGGLLAKHLIVRPERIRLKGEIGSRPDPGPAGEWVIAGVKVVATAETRLNTRGGTLEVGDWAEAVLEEEPAGVLTARLLAGIEPEDAVEVHGVIQKFDAAEWTLSSIPVKLDAETVVAGEPAAGLIAAASADLQTDGSLLAKRLRVSYTDRSQVRPPVQFTGAIEKLPDAGLVGVWTVAGKSVVVTPGARIRQEKGLAVVGARVEVVGWQANDRVMAMLITVLESPVEGGVPVRFGGRIQALPDGGTTGAWQVAGRTVAVTAQTVLRGDPPKVGSWAWVEGVRRASGGVVAMVIMVHKAQGRPGGG
jgi:hypothetical protein